MRCLALFRPFMSDSLSEKLSHNSSYRYYLRSREHALVRAFLTLWCWCRSIDLLIFLCMKDASQDLFRKFCSKICEHPMKHDLGIEVPSYKYVSRALYHSYLWMGIFRRAKHTVELQVPIHRPVVQNTQSYWRFLAPYSSEFHKKFWLFYHVVYKSKIQNRSAWPPFLSHPTRCSQV